MDSKVETKRQRMMNPKTPELFIFTALECEAKALINHFKLKKANTNYPFSIFSNENMVVTVTGVGKVAMAGGVAYVLALFPDVNMPVLVNVGIAGDKTHELGSLLIASKIRDVESGKVFYPQLIGDKWPESREIRSSVLADTNYSIDCLYDMEASAFYEMAVKFSSIELIHSIKVVSDNESSPVEAINAKKVVEWIGKQVENIEKTFSHLEQLRQMVLPISLPEYKKITDRWHFSVSGKVKLKYLLRQWHVLSNSDWLESTSSEHATAKEVLHQLAVDIDQIDIIL